MEDIFNIFPLLVEQRISSEWNFLWNSAQLSEVSLLNDGITMLVIKDVLA
jgi:hypothetical protein